MNLQPLARAKKLWPLLLLLAGGCFAGPAALAPLGLMAAQNLGAGTATMAAGKSDEVDEGERAQRCDQVLRAAPWVDEVRTAPDGTIQMRRWVVAPGNGEGLWTVAPGKSGDGWRTERNIASFKFNPSLEDALKAAGGSYLVSIPAEPRNAMESNQVMSAVAVFGPSAGSYTWHGAHYRFTVVKKLPCFPRS